MFLYQKIIPKFYFKFIIRFWELGPRFLIHTVSESERLAWLTMTSVVVECSRRNNLKITIDYWQVMLPHVSSVLHFIALIPEKSRKTRTIHHLGNKKKKLFNPWGQYMRNNVEPLSEGSKNYVMREIQV